MKEEHGGGDVRAEARVVSRGDVTPLPASDLEREREAVREVDASCGSQNGGLGRCVRDGSSDDAVSVVDDWR